MMKKCLVASHNADKVREIREILEDLPFEVYAASDLGEVLEVEEDASSFAGNAKLKAEAYRKHYPYYYVLAELPAWGGRF